MSSILTGCAIGGPGLPQEQKSRSLILRSAIRGCKSGVKTQQARERVWNGQDYTFTDNLSWIRGKHAFSFGGRAQIEHFLHVRDDKVTGGISTPLYFVAKGGNFND